ncbi:RNA polymerase sigma factor [Desulfosporosinus sp. FKB]|uniref:RNA polymerase sigma factor n=1 Tax=Desulfosporosinus sp. FKB TaxID=1969835 RepID=UPI0014826D36|nr:RNA polymerase sigma factor [Desulfosporosinus sp. FKB]
MAELDISLIEQVLSGDSEAFNRLVQNYSAYVYRTAFAFLHDKSEAEDASQEIFLKVYRSIHHLKDVHVFPAWFKKVITSVCLDRIKLKKLDIVPESQIESISSSLYNPRDIRIEIREALNMLSSEERELVLMVDWQGYNYQEIAAILKIPLGTVKSRIHAARLHLKKILSDET